MNEGKWKNISSKLFSRTPSHKDVRNITVMNIFAHEVEQVKRKPLNLIPRGGTSPLAQDMDQRKALATMAMNLEVPQT